MTAPLVAMRDALGEALLEFAPKYPDMVVLDADVSSSTRTAAFGKAHPARFFNVGVAEANMVDIAAGMATCGLRPVASTFALFIALRAADPVRNIVCYNNLPVVFAANYAGLSDSYDGASHQSIADVAMMRALPNMTVVVPADAVELKQALEASLLASGPTYIRICRNATPVLFEDSPPLQVGRIRKLRDGSDLTIAVCGVPTFMAIDAAGRLVQSGISVDLLEVSTVKPIDAGALTDSARKTGRVLTVEEHTIYGGLAGAVAEVLGRFAPVPMDSIGVEDKFPESGDYMQLMGKYGISTDGIEARARALVRGRAA
ncbi:MAG: transketolase C-terminal domain-containing protein [Acidobacteriota bacterium]